MNALFTYAIVIILTASITYGLTVLHQSIAQWSRSKNEKRGYLFFKDNITKLSEIMNPIEILEFGMLDRKSISITTKNSSGPSKKVKEF